MRQQIVIFGDSITQQSFRSGGWGAALADTYSRKADILNRGYGGYNTRWALFLLHHIFPLGSAKPPVVTTVFFGANDAALPGRTSERQHVPVDEYKENLRRIVKHLKECSSAMLIVLITPPPIDEEGRFEYARLLYGDKAMTLPERTSEMTGIYADKCVELAKELNLPSINLWSKMQQTEGWQKKYLSVGFEGHRELHVSIFPREFTMPFKCSSGCSYIDGLHLTEEGNAVVYKEVLRVLSEAWHTASELPYDFPHHSEIDSENPEKAFQKQCAGAGV